MAISLESLCQLDCFLLLMWVCQIFFQNGLYMSQIYFTLASLQLLAVTIYILLEACLLKKPIYYVSAFHFFSSIFPISWLFSKDLVVLSTVVSVMRLPTIYRVFLLNLPPKHIQLTPSNRKQVSISDPK